MPTKPPPYNERVARLTSLRLGYPDKTGRLSKDPPRTTSNANTILNPLAAKYASGAPWKHKRVIKSKSGKSELSSPIIARARKKETGNGPIRKG